MTETPISDGGPAFPQHDLKAYGMGPAQRGESYTVEGMSLRDWFAGKALAGISSIAVEGFSLSAQEEARWAYDRADAMIAARGVQP